MKSCPHLEPLERYLEARGIVLGEGKTSPYGPEAGLWCEAECTFDAPALRVRLGIPDSITYEEYDGRHAGSDATWFCRECKRAIWGSHPRYAVPGTPRIS